MKAYRISDRTGYSDYSVVTFAETPGKAKLEALGTDEFPSSDWDFIELSARRVPILDKYYHGKSQMDWYDMNDRIALVKDAGCYCEPDSADLDECRNCEAREWCSMYEEMMEECSYEID